MGIEDFIREAHYKPNDYIAYHIGRELAELYPGKAIIEGNTGYFDLEAFVRADKCSVIAESSVFNHVRTGWLGPRKDLRERINNAWLNVLWQGQLMEVVLITWSESYYRSRHHWIVADDKKLAEDFFSEVCKWSSEVRGELLVFQDGEWEKNKELYDAIKTATFDNLILPDALKQEIQNDFGQFFLSRDVYERYRIPWKRGVLFIGPPGNGKTHTLKALINQLVQPCLYVKGFKSEDATEQENMRLVFERARMTTPCLLVFEDLDSMIDNENRAFFLNELDGFETNTGVVVLATTNHPEKLDPAILDRPSRFDRKYYFDLPAEAERLAYIAAWNNELQPDMRLSESATLKVAQRTDGFSFAHLKELFLSSMMQWMATDRTASMDEIILSQGDRLRTQISAQEEESVSASKLSRLFRKAVGK